MMARRNPGVGELRAMLLAALVSRQPEFTLEAAGDLIDDAGFTAVLDAVLEALPRIIEKLRGMSPLWDEFQRGLCDSVVAPRNGAKTVK